jgi:hypothetical protein
MKVPALKQRFTLLFSSAMVASLLAVSGCTFNKPTEASKNVSVVKVFNVTGCEKLGTTTAQVQSSLGGVDFSKEKVQEELINIVKNDAGAMGGDSVVAVSPVIGGMQKFDIYKCAK